MTVWMILLGICLVLHVIETGWRLADRVRGKRRPPHRRPQAPGAITDADRRQALRQEAETANFLSYTGDAQMPVDEYELMERDV